MVVSVQFPLLGIDYGQNHIGLAIAQSSLTEPLATIPTPSAIQQIQSLISKHQIKALVVGISEGDMAGLTHQFATQLRDLTGLPIYFQDETLTSRETRIKLAKAKMKRSKRQGKIDHYVAAAILQDYLDSQL